MRKMMYDSHIQQYSQALKQLSCIHAYIYFGCILGRCMHGPCVVLPDLCQCCALSSHALWVAHCYLPSVLKWEAGMPFCAFHS
jgi:hypothetical protein